jgi:hypothetical protein
MKPASAIKIHPLNSEKTHEIWGQPLAIRVMSQHFFGKPGEKNGIDNFLSLTNALMGDPNAYGLAPDQWIPEAACMTL